MTGTGTPGPAETPGPRDLPPARPDATFEELMEDLETVTAKLAAGDLGIEAAADLYARAEQLHALATERLAQVRARVESLHIPPSQ